jgi:hypothetical protein
VILYVVDSSFLYNSDNFTHEYYTRNKNDFLMRGHRLTMYEKSPRYSGNKLFNLLPKHIKELRTGTVIKFKAGLKQFLMTKCYYSVQEFINDNVL